MKNHFLIKLGKVIKRKRITAKLSILEWSKLSKVSATTIQDIEKGIVNPRLSTLIKLAKGLKMPIQAFIYPL